MRIDKIHINNFGKHQNLDLLFDQGFNLLSGNNESGKTTVLQFILAMFYGFANVRVKDLERNERKRYQPWHGGEFGGYLEFSNNKSQYRLSRRFGKRASEDQLTLIDLLNGQTIKIPKNLSPGDHLLGLSREEFIRSVFIDQRSTKIEKEEKIRTKLMAATSGAATGISIAEIRNNLDTQRKNIEPPRKKGSLKIAAEELKNLEEERVIALHVSEEVAATRTLLTRTDTNIGKNTGAIKQIIALQSRRTLEKELANLTALIQRQEKCQELNKELQRGLEELGMKEFQELPDRELRKQVSDNLTTWRTILTIEEHLNQEIKEKNTELQNTAGTETLKQQLSSYQSFNTDYQHYLELQSNYKEQKQTAEKVFSETLSKQREQLQQHQLDWQKTTNEHQAVLRLLETENNELDQEKKDKIAADQVAKEKIEKDYAAQNERVTFLQQGLQKVMHEYQQERAKYERICDQISTLQQEKSELEESLKKDRDDQYGLQKTIQTLGDTFAQQEQKLKDERTQKLNHLKAEYSSIPIRNLPENAKNPSRHYSQGSSLTILGVLFIVAAIVLYFTLKNQVAIAAIFGFLGLIFLLFGIIQTNKRIREQNNAVSYIQKQDHIEQQYASQLEKQQQDYLQKSQQTEALLQPLTQSVETKQHQIMLLKSRLENALSNQEEQAQRENMVQKECEDVRSQLEQAKGPLETCEQNREHFQPLASEKYLNDYTAEKERIEKERTEHEADFTVLQKSHQEFVAQTKQQLSEAHFTEPEELSQLGVKLADSKQKIISSYNKLFANQKQLADIETAPSFRDEQEINIPPQINEQILDELNLPQVIRQKIHQLDQQIATRQNLELGLTKAKTQLAEQQKQLEKLLSDTDQWLFEIEKTEDLSVAEKIFDANIQHIENLEILQAKLKNQLEELQTQQIRIGGNDPRQKEAELRQKLSKERIEEEFSSPYKSYSDQELEQKKEKISLLQNELVHKKGTLEQQLDQLLSSSRVLQQIDEDIGNKQQEIISLEQQLADLDLAITMLDEMNDEMQKTFGPVINERMMKILAEITGEKEQQVLIDHEFKVKLEDPQTQRLYEAEYYSGGKVDQIYLAMRLAIALTLYDDAEGEHLPMFIDDSLIQYDSQRSRIALTYLNKMAEEENRQIVFATCHQIYESYLGEQANVILLEA